MKIHKYFQIALFLLPLTLSAKDSTAHFVNAVTGDMEIHTVDYVVKGDKSIPLQRKRLFSTTPRSDQPLWKMMEAIGVFPQLHLYLKKENGRYVAEMTDDTFGECEFIDYKHCKNEIHLRFQKRAQKGTSPFAYNFSPSAVDNPNNSSLTIYRERKQAVMNMPNGSIRYYGIASPHRTKADKRAGHFWKLGYRYRLEKEIHLDGTETIYTYNGEQEVTIQRTNQKDGEVYCSVKIQPAWFPAYGVDVFGSDGKYVTYHLNTMDGKIFISSVELGLTADKNKKDNNSIHRPYTYLKDEYKNRYFVRTFFMNEDSYRVAYTLPEYRELEDDTVLVEFNPSQGKVAKIYKNEELLVSFNHMRKMTVANFADGTSKKFYHANGRLQKIESFDEQQALIGIVEYEWEGSLLKRKYLSKTAEKRDSKIEFSYDSYQNLKEKEEVEMLPLTKDDKNTDKAKKGKPQQREGDKIVTTYTYNKEHRCILKKQVKKIKKVMDYGKEEKFNKEKKEKYDVASSTETEYTYDQETGALTSTIIDGVEE
ncbi:hypothetical protein K0U07_02435 [bacterium]|nr:hypothetical protein [bacterium]